MEEIEETRTTRTMTPEELQNILEHGFCYIEDTPGSFRKITSSDLLISREDVERIMSILKKLES